jgi:hypothetical protein
VAWQRFDLLRKNVVACHGVEACGGNYCKKVLSYASEKG